MSRTRACTAQKRRSRSLCGNKRTGPLRPCQSSPPKAEARPDQDSPASAFTQVLQTDQSPPEPDDHGFRTRADSELVEDVSQVNLDRPHADVEAASHAEGAHAPSGPTQHL